MTAAILDFRLALAQGTNSSPRAAVPAVRTLAVAHPAAGHRRLACHWLVEDGRLACYWGQDGAHDPPSVGNH